MTLPADLAALLADLRPAAERATRLQARRRRTTIAIAAIAIAVTLAGVAVAAVEVLGKPAPKPVQAQIHGEVVGHFPGHPNLVKSTARVLAEAPDATLYGISDRLGNYCIELIGVTKGLNYGGSCGSAIQIGQTAASGGTVDPQIISIITNGLVPPVVHYGRLASGTIAARAVYPNGATEKIQIGTNGFFVFEPSPAHQAIARRQPLIVQFIERNGGTLSYQLLPPQPLASTGKHYDQISGRVVIAGAAKLQITIHDSASRRPTIVDLPVTGNGTFSWNGQRLKLTQFPTFTVLDSRNQPLTDQITETLTEPSWRAIIAEATAHS